MRIKLPQETRPRVPDMFLNVKRQVGEEVKHQCNRVVLASGEQGFVPGKTKFMSSDIWVDKDEQERKKARILNWQHDFVTLSFRAFVGHPHDICAT